MDPIMLMMMAGTGISASGGIKANSDQSNAEQRNADFYNKQAEFAQQATDRQLDLTTQEGERFKEAQLSGFAKAGIEISGSPLLAISDTAAKVESEKSAIRSEGYMNWLLASQRAQDSQIKADRLGSISYNGLQAAGTILGGMGKTGVDSAQRGAAGAAAGAG